MVGGDLSVRRFTPQAGTVLGLTSADIGRPMPRLRLKLDVGQRWERDHGLPVRRPVGASQKSAVLEQNMLDVIQQVESQELRIRNDEGKWYSVRAHPAAAHLSFALNWIAQPCVPAMWGALILLRPQLIWEPEKPSMFR